MLQDANLAEFRPKKEAIWKNPFVYLDQSIDKRIQTEIYETFLI